MKFLIALIAGLLVGTGAYADVTGNITPPGGVGATIPIPLTNLVPSPPSTIVGNCTTSTGAPLGNGWSCSVADVTTPAGNATQQTSSALNSAGFTNYSRTLGSAAAWPASDTLQATCVPN